MNNADQYQPTFAKYVGVAGRAGKTMDAVKSALGGDASPDFINYNKFITNATLVANEARRTLGGQATDHESNIMDNLVKPDFWYSNPSIAMAQWNELQQIYKTRINPALAKGMLQTKQDLSPSVNLGGGVGANPSQQDRTVTVGDKTYTKINGKWFQQ
jgi:hypothetical protein